MREPVTITSNGEPTLVVMSVDAYEKLQERAQPKSLAGGGDEQGYTPIMERTRAIARLLENRDALAKLGVAHVALYGSVARNTADELSDVDVVVDSADGKALGLFALARITEQLEQILGRSVDVISRRGLDHTKRLKQRVAADLVDVY